MPEELKREAVPGVASGEMTSREAAEELGVDSSVVRNWKRQLLGGTKGAAVAKGEPEREAAAPQADPDALRGEISALNADLERLRAEYRAMEIRLAIMRGSAELVGKEPGADPDNLASREKTIPVRKAGEALGVNAESLLGEVGIARSTYYYQLRAMNRHDKDMGPLALIRDVFENGRRRYGYKRVHLELRSADVVVSAKRVMRLMTAHGLVPVSESAKRYSSYKGVLLQCLLGGFGSVFPQCGLMVFPGVVIVSR
ncbi:IS3 family transposase [Bifidobacterium longum]|uniref:IS3 family transposase n=1 Tax=Bifidobacterium longum TaxID=216816 RepID=UPI003F576EBC